MDELMKRENSLNDPQPEDAYRSIWGYVIEAGGQRRDGDRLLEDRQVDF